MKRLILVAITLLILLMGVYYSKRQPPEKSIINVENKTEIPSDSIAPEEINFTASFEIYTNGTKRIFTDTKYHNLSKDIYITSEDPSIIHIKKADVTWSDFFATLPMKLTKDCLTTGTGQVFCSNDTQKLKFFINDIENPDALNQNIKNGDNLRVKYD